MSLRNPFSRWAFQSPNLNLNFASSQSNTIMRMPTHFPIRRTFSLQQQLRTRQPQRFRYPSSQSQSNPQFRSFHSTRSRREQQQSKGPEYTYQSPNQSPSFSQRLKALSREYGWSALWIYLFLSALDFPFCFAAVRFLGADKIGHYEHVVVEGVKEAVRKVWPGAVGPAQNEEEEEEGGKEAETQVAEKMKNGGAEGASLWTQLALAYAIHKSFIFVRVPLTAAITPKVVKALRQWGWDVVKGKAKGR